MCGHILFLFSQGTKGIADYIYDFFLYFDLKQKLAMCVVIFYFFSVKGTNEPASWQRTKGITYYIYDFLLYFDLKQKLAMCVVIFHFLTAKFGHISFCTVRL